MARRWRGVGGRMARILVCTTFLAASAPLSAPPAAIADVPGTIAFSDTQVIDMSSVAGGDYDNATPSAVVVDDFDSDGRLDFAVACAGISPVDTLVAVYFQEDDGSYPDAPVEIDLPGSPSDVTSADMDRDGCPDLIVADDTEEFITITSNGDGTFGTPDYWSVGSASSVVNRVVVGDLDNDGDVDVVAHESDGDDLYFFLNDGSGGLADSGDWWGLSGDTEAFALADIDNNGYLDLLAGGPDSSFTVIYDCAGMWDDDLSEHSEDYAISGWMREFATGDVDNDGDVDVIAKTGSSVMLLENDRSSSVLVDGVDLGLTAMDEDFTIGLADFDRDGVLDLASTKTGLKWARGVGDGTFATPESTSVNVNGGMAIADLDRDGLADVVATAWYGPEIRIIGNVSTRQVAASEAPTFERITISLEPNLYAVGVADFNLDGHDDIATLSYLGQSAAVWRGNGEGAFAGGGTGIVAAGNPSDLAIADFDRDGAPDIGVASWAAGRVSIWHGNRDGFFATSEPLALMPATNAWRISSGDYDGDGDVDMSAAAGSTAKVYDNSGDGHIATEHTYSPAGVARVLDAVPWNYSTGVAPKLAVMADSPFLWMMQLDPVFGLQSFADGTGCNGPMAAADFGRDGWDDLIVPSGTSGHAVGMWREPDDGPVVQDGPTLEYGASDVAVGDINNDGCPDAIVAASAGDFFPYTTYYPWDTGEGVAYVLLGDGEGAVSVSTTLETGPGCRSVALGDFNEDGLTDIVTANSGASTGDAGLSLFLQIAEEPEPPAPTPAETERVKADDRYGVSVNIARETFDPTGDKSWSGGWTAVIACGEDKAAADPLAAAGLCGMLDAPLFLVKSNSVPSSVIDAIVQMAQANGELDIVIVGGTSSVPDARFNEIKAAVAARTGQLCNKDRVLAGGDRYDLASAIAARMAAAMGAPDRVLVANGADSKTFFDALALSAIAADEGYPILLTKKDTLPAATSNRIKAIAPDECIVAGGKNTVSAAVLGKLPNAKRWSGATKYSTAVAVAQNAKARGWLDYGTVGIAAKQPDALTGGVLCGMAGGPLLVTSGTSLSSETGAFLGTNKTTIEHCVIFGGEKSVYPIVKTQIEAKLKL